MRITVCIKQVPGTAQVEIDPATGVLKRDGVESKMNPYDLYALETALRFKQSHNAEITVVSMGPPQAAGVIREAYMMGVDHGVLFSDRRFGGADVLATAYTLAQGIKSMGGADIIICGKQTTDGDTAQVGAEIAEFLGIPHVAGVSNIHEVTRDDLMVDLDLPIHIETVRVKMPCLICVEKGIFEPRLPSFRLKLQTDDREVKIYSLDDMDDTNPDNYGLNGSPTQVKRIFPPESRNAHERWDGTPDELTGKLFDYLEDGKFLQQLR